MGNFIGMAVLHLTQSLIFTPYQKKIWLDQLAAQSNDRSGSTNYVFTHIDADVLFQIKYRHFRPRKHWHQCRIIHIKEFRVKILDKPTWGTLNFWWNWLEFTIGFTASVCPIPCTTYVVLWLHEIGIFCDRLHSTIECLNFGVWTLKICLPNANRHSYAKICRINCLMYLLITVF